jgi:hypothetical protein
MTCIVSLLCLVLAQTESEPQPKPAVELAPAPRIAGRATGNGAPAHGGVRHALIICGHPGDAEHVKSFTETIRKLSDGLAKNVGIAVDRQHILFGAERPKDFPGATGPATREAVVAAVAEMRKTLRPEDGLWVICLGHCHHDGRQAWWNLPGPDLSAAEFGKLFADVSAREQVFVMTMSLSGYFVAPLSRRERVVIAATEADAETNETTFPAIFAQFVASGLNPAEHDVDSDGKLTLFDLYVVVAKEIAQNYVSGELVATEHQQIDDDGDGIGHEAQTPFLPAELGGGQPGKKSKRPPSRDGLLAAQILLAPGK